VLRRLANSDHATLVLARRLQARGPHTEGFQILDVHNAGEDGGSNQGHISDVGASQAGPDDTETVPVLHTDSAPPPLEGQQIFAATPTHGVILENVVLIGPQSQEAAEVPQTTTTEGQQRKGITEAETEEAEDQDEETQTAIAKSLGAAVPTQSRDDEDDDSPPEHQFNRTVPGRGRESRIVDPQGFGVARGERERMERERVEQERVEQEQEEQRLLSRRLQPVKIGYHRNLRCMDGTRQSILNQIMDWVANKLRQEDVSQRNMYWLYGLPGIGKTSLAHSICANLHERNHLAGAFFCRRDDPNLSEPKNILPTFIHELAIIFPPFRTIVAQHLRDHPNLTLESMKDTLLLDFIRSLPQHPNHTLVFVIDAFDECGDARRRPRLLKALTDATVQAPWLKIIVTSRTEVDIQHFFDTLTQSSYFPYDLASDQDASADLRTFARSQFDSLASFWHFDTPWPKESDFEKAISRARGLFIFIKTLVLILEQCENPKESLKAALADSASTGLESLFELYSSILKSRIVHDSAGFRRVIGVLLTTAPYRALCDETIAELAGVEQFLVKRWVDALNSVLYRDDAANNGVRVRHLSVYDFFRSDRCSYQVNVRDADVQLGIACLKAMTTQLHFNICKLEDSRLANADVRDLPSRVEQNISDALQYSCRHWLDHLYFPPANRDQRVLVLGSVKEFFEGLYPLFWVEVLSIMGMVPIGVPSLRRLLSWVRVSTLACCCFGF